MRSIQDKTVFLSIHFQRYGNTRKVATSQVEVDADKRRIHVSKRLLESKKLLEIKGLDFDAMDYVTGCCLPFEKGIHFLPLALVEQVEAELRAYEQKRNQLIQEFVDEYPGLLEEARKPLGGLFDERDYPSPSQARAQFNMRWNYLSLSTPGKLATLNPGLFRAELEKIERQMQESYEEWHSLLRVAMADLVERLRESLCPSPDGKAKKLTESSVQNLQNFLQTFSFRNVTDDAELEKICAEVKQIMGGVTVEQLRESENLKSKTGIAIAEASKALQTMTAGIRRFRDDD
jgi:hypothetical protein